MQGTDSRVDIAMRAPEGDCHGHEEAVEVGGVQFWGCDRADLTLKILGGVRDALRERRQFKCHQGSCGDEDWACRIMFSEGVREAIEGAIIWDFLELPGCKPVELGWRATWPGGTVRSECRCVPTAV